MTAEWGKLTVAEIKAELRGRGISFLSKQKKAELVQLLVSNQDRPLDPSKMVQQPKQAKKPSGHWKSGQPIRKLLYFEFKEGNIPLDPNEMGPAEVFCRYSGAPEFEDVDYNDMFVQRLRTLRQQIMREEPLLKWNEYHPARALIMDELAAGSIPLDTQQMGPAEVWSNYAHTAQFKMRGMKFGETFKRRLAALRKQVGRDKNRAEEDHLEVLKAIKLHPAPSHNHRGEPQWSGSKAQQLLKEAIDRGDHFEKSPAELRNSDPAFKEFMLNTFRWKIHQETRTRKYLHTLKHDAEQKLRKNLKKMTI